jgi:hypothetical protein
MEQEMADAMKGMEDDEWPEGAAPGPGNEENPECKQS